MNKQTKLYRQRRSLSRCVLLVALACLCTSCVCWRMAPVCEVKANALLIRKDAATEWIMHYGRGVEGVTYEPTLKALPCNYMIEKRDGEKYARFLEDFHDIESGSVGRYYHEFAISVQDYEMLYREGLKLQKHLRCGAKTSRRKSRDNSRYEFIIKGQPRMVEMDNEESRHALEEYFQLMHKVGSRYKKLAPLKEEGRADADLYKGVRSLPSTGDISDKMR